MEDDAATNTAPSESFSISFRVDFWTRYRASIILLHRLSIMWICYGLFVLLPLLMFIASLLLHWDLRAPKSFNLPGWASLLAGPVFILVLLPLIQVLQMWSAARGNKTLGGVQHQSFTSEGFSTSGDTFQTSLKWEAFRKAVETKHYFFLYFTSQAAYFIPKAKLSSAADIDHLRQVLKHYLAEKAQF